MQAKKEDLLSELEALDAMMLKQMAESEIPVEPNPSLEEKMIHGVYQHWSTTKKEAQVIDLQSGIRRNRAGRMMLYKMVAGIAAIFLMGILSYRFFFPGTSTDHLCKGQNQLSCLLQKTSEEEIFDYLLQEYPATDDEYILENLDNLPNYPLLPETE